MKKTIKVQEVKSNAQNRRSFLKISGLAIAGTGLFLAGCSDDDDPINPPSGQVFDLGSGDLGILNYAYALEQLEADFYDRVVNANNFGSTFNSEEQQILVDIYNHEVVHREFFKAAITGAAPNQNQVLPMLDFEYSGFNFSDRMMVLQTAKTLEDTGVAAYNGAGRYITTPDYLVIAGKIVSVEARHAAAIRDLLNPGSASFAGDDIIDPNGLDDAKKPSQIISEVSALGIIQTPFTANSLA